MPRPLSAPASRNGALHSADAAKWHIWSAPHVWPDGHVPSAHDVSHSASDAGRHDLTARRALLPAHDRPDVHRKQTRTTSITNVTWQVGGLDLERVGVDDQAPAMEPPDPTYAYEEQFLFTNCVLDGHHRIQAAAELGAPVRILSLVAEDFSLVKSAGDLTAVLAGYVR